MKNSVSSSEHRWVLIWAAAIVLLASVPYIIGICMAPSGLHFLGFTHNIDDGAVYLSWMHQAADGHFFIRNLYTNDFQPARQFNLLFLIMGVFARLTRIPLVWVFHIFRVGLGFALILAVWKFSCLFSDDPKHRKLLAPILGLSAGVGYLIPGARMPTGPVDIWQPEAVTFLSIYLNPLFLAGLILIVGAFYFLLLAERTGRARYAACGGLCVLLLGNIHTYDVLTVAAVWAVYLIVRGIVDRRFPGRILLLSLLAALIAAPSIAYQVYVYIADPVYRARANSPIPSPPVWSYMAGYGLVLAGAVAGGVILLKSARKDTNAVFRVPHLLLFVWAIIGFIVPYAPIAQQRKLIMGLHIPLCILCVYALSWLFTRLPPSAARLAMLGFIIVCFGSNAHFVGEDMKFLSEGTTAPKFPAYIASSEMEAMNYLGEQAARGETVLAPPGFSLMIPAIAGAQVYYGHWSETPDYATKLNEWLEFSGPGCPGGIRIAMLKTWRISHYIGDLTPDAAREAHLEVEYSARGVVIYRVHSGR